jgi:meiotically up-regulated gene 157 (Mug157) protein
MIYDAVVLMVRTWIVEERHNATTSPYRFAELDHRGVGNPVGYTGMIWSAFRPSDDTNGYGYSIPSNMYVAGALQRVLELNRAVWQSEEFEKMASSLLKEVVSGIETFGIVQSTDYPERPDDEEEEGNTEQLQDGDPIPSLMICRQPQRVLPAQKCMHTR